MEYRPSRVPGRWRRAADWVTALVASQAQSVPDVLRACEFGCDEPVCSPERWRTCERRLTLEANPFVRPRD